MILLRILVFFLGMAIVGATLISAIRSFVLPRSARDQLSRAVFLTTRFFFTLRTRRAVSYEERDAIMALYAPVSLLILPAVWLVVVQFGYMCMYWALGVNSWRAAFLLSGSSLLTLGFAPVEGIPRTMLVFSEAAIGLVLVALLIAYLPTMYAAFSKREAAVNMLEVRAGSPPSAVEMFERFNRLHRLDQLHDLWITWELWFADVEETHTSLAALAFFRSPQPDRSWITAAGAILDAASMASSTLDLPKDPQVDLCIRAGYLALRRIADFFAIQYNPKPTRDDPISVTRDEFEIALNRLASAGVPLKPDREQAWRDFKGWRVNYDTVLLALAALTMAPYAPWSSDRSLRPQRRAFLNLRS
ncbi:MAG: hypothetical protein EXR62_10500 [Chloroflexi bacterium]|nr:hypothetical protein [Chloroflexota bacterium]